MNLIKCPSCNIPRDERIKELFEQIEEFIMSHPFQELLELFGFSPKQWSDKSLKEKINEMNSFVKTWDYRNGERWTIEDDEFVEDNKEIILKDVKSLGFLDMKMPSKKTNYILPLGGARMSNYLRCNLAKEMVDYFNDNIDAVVALSGMRPIDKEVEQIYIDKYAPHAKTEFDAISAAVEGCFNVKTYEEEKYDDNNINFSWVKRHYIAEKEYIIDSLAAPSSNSDRRANSLDTFEFFISEYDIKSNDRMLLVTSSHYETFQMLLFMGIAIEKNIFIDTVGVERGAANSGLYKASDFVQELKSVVNSMKFLADKYL